MVLNAFRTVSKQIVTLPFLPTMAPARGTALLARHAPTAAATPPRRRVAPLDLLPPKRHPTASAELPFRGSNSQRPTLAWRCWRRHHRDRWTPRRPFQVRSACPRVASEGPRPGQCPGTCGASDSGHARRRRTAPVRPQSALPSSLLPSPHLPPRPTRLPSTRGASRPHDPPLVAA